MPDDMGRAGGAAWMDSLLYDTYAGHGALESEHMGGVRPWPVETLDSPGPVPHRAVPPSGAAGADA